MVCGHIEARAPQREHPVLFHPKHDGQRPTASLPRGCTLSLRPSGTWTPPSPTSSDLAHSLAPSSEHIDNSAAAGTKPIPVLEKSVTKHMGLSILNLLTPSCTCYTIFTRMMVAEFQSAKIDDQGSHVVSVKDHKTFVKHGPQPFVFLLDGLYEAVSQYLNSYR